MKRWIVTVLAGIGFASVPAMAAGFVLTSPTVKAGAMIPPVHSFDGGNRSPKLEWSGVPAGTASFAVTVFDPDAPRQGGWWHWLVADIPASVTRLEENAGRTGVDGLPKGSVAFVSDFGDTHYDGPCPPSGVHRYIFTVYALKTARLNVPVQSRPAVVKKALETTALAKASITGKFGSR